MIVCVCRGSGSGRLVAENIRMAALNRTFYLFSATGDEPEKQIRFSAVPEL